MENDLLALTSAWFMALNQNIVLISHVICHLTMLQKIVNY